MTFLQDEGKENCFLYWSFSCSTQISRNFMSQKKQIGFHNERTDKYDILSIKLLKIDFWVNDLRNQIEEDA